MTEERRRVLEMVAKGTISQEDGIKLLEALGEEGGAETVDLAGSSPIEEGPTEEDSMGEGTIGSVPIGVCPIAVEPTPPTPPVEHPGKRVPELVLEQGIPWEESLSVQQVQRSPDQSSQGVLRPNPDHVLAQRPPLPTQPKGEWCAPPSPEEQGYAVPGLSEGIEEIDISWVSGPVEIRVYDGAEIQVTEYSKWPLSEGQKLFMTVKNEKLSIRWSRDKVNFGLLLRSKHLVVQLPRHIAENLEKLKCQNVSGTIYLFGIRCEETNLNSTSGKIMAEGVQGEEIKLTSVSGKIELYQAAAEDIKVNTTSGSILTEEIACEDGDFVTVSGRVQVRGNGENFRLKSVSGSLSLAVGQCPERAELNTVSGSSEMALPENQGFQVQYNSVSGHFETDFPVSGNIGKKSGKLCYGSQNAEFRFNSVSGSMRLRKL